MWSTEVSSHWRSKPNLGTNRQCVLCAWPTDGLRHTKACMCALTESETRTGSYTHTCARRHGVTQHLASHETHMKGMGKSHALSLIHANTCSDSKAHSRTYSWSLTPFTKQSHTARTLVVSHVFPFAIVYMLTESHTHRIFSLHASLHGTFNPKDKLLYRINHTVYHYELLPTA